MVVLIWPVDLMLNHFYFMKGNTGHSRRYAFVYYESVEDAKVAKEAMVNQKFNGRPIRVNFYYGKPTALHGPSD